MNVLYEDDLEDLPVVAGYPDEDYDWPRRNIRHPVPAGITLLAGGMAGTAAVAVTYPFEVIQTRFQSSLTAEYRVNRHIVPRGIPPIIHYLRRLLTTEGYGCFYRGIGINLFGIFPARAVYFTTYTQVKNILFSFKSLRSYPNGVHITSGFCASIAATTATCPIWFIKTRLQLDQCCDCSFFKITRILRQTYRTEGFIGYYRGLTASYLGVFESMVYFLFYERVRNVFRRYFHDSNLVLQSGAASAISKAIAAISLYPHEVIRTRLRQPDRTPQGDRKYLGIIRTAKVVVREEGPAALYGGLSAHLLRQLPNTMILFVVYESLLFMSAKAYTTY